MRTYLFNQQAKLINNSTLVTNPLHFNAMLYYVYFGSGRAQQFVFEQFNTGKRDPYNTF